MILMILMPWRYSTRRKSGVKVINDGYSALWLALARGNLIVARLLLVAGAIEKK